MVDVRLVLTPDLYKVAVGRVQVVLKLYFTFFSVRPQDRFVRRNTRETMNVSSANRSGNMNIPGLLT
jgi:hypothetical protein